LNELLAPKDCQTKCNNLLLVSGGGELADWQVLDCSKGSAMKYSQLTPEDRSVISVLRRGGYSISDIAQVLKRDRSTIYRELSRNATDTPKGLVYCVSKAQEKRNGRLRRSRRGSHHGEEDYALVRKLLEAQWSPEQIAGTLKRLGELQISHQTIYRYVRGDWKSGGSLWKQLRRRYKRRKRHYGLERRGRMQGKRMIDERPAAVEERQEVGHWELDTVQGASGEKACVVTLVERVTGVLLVEKVPDKTVKSVNRALIMAIRRSPLPVLTITADNGTEFHGYRKVEIATGVTIYFARPYHPWERGTNENTNGLLRQYWPKGNSMADLTQAQCNAVSHKLNTRPRKRHGYFSPLQLVA
jgi:IS30 family transposase